MINVLQQIKDKQPNWFSSEAMSFSNDIQYLGLQNDEKENYLIINTYGFTDMFDGVKKPHYRVKKVGEDYKIGELYENIFDTLKEAEEFIK